jgi:hypothetical protein
MRKEPKNDQRIERAYYARCGGIQIDIMDIGKVFKVGQGFLTTYPNATDDQLADRIAAYVETIRKN